VAAEGARANQPRQPRSAEKIGLPVRPFLYTIDQIAVILDLSEERIRAGYVFYEGRSVGFATRDLLMARNIAPQDEKPEWRIAEQELLRWLKRRGFKVYDRAFVGW
jgi:hypothetical protein